MPLDAAAGEHRLDDPDDWLPRGQESLRDDPVVFGLALQGHLHGLALAGDDHRVIGQVLQAKGENSSASRSGQSDLVTSHLPELPLELDFSDGKGLLLTNWSVVESGAVFVS